jgi:nucleoside triphosphate diphosphatase
VTVDNTGKSADSGCEGKDKGAIAGEVMRLLSIMARLRDPEAGCPWDQEQTFATIAPYTIEEAYEVADAIERCDKDDLKDELGDLLLQVVYHARFAEEEGEFAFVDVARAICEKMIRRHPHVFGAGEEQLAPPRWEEIKQAERQSKPRKAGAGLGSGLFEGIPRGLPALTRSAKLQSRASRAGFDWPSPGPVLDKVEEELHELRVEMEAPSDPDSGKRQFEEFGDALFAMVNLGLRLGFDPEAALRAANAKFIRRMEAVEARAEALGKTLPDMTLEQMQRLWDETKAAES